MNEQGNECRHEMEPGRRHLHDDERHREQGHESRPDDKVVAESNEALARDGPRIYVASLTDYNAGLLHGRWIDAAGDVETLRQQIDEMLRTSPTRANYGDSAEEWAIHDYDGFGDLRLGEHEALSTVALVASGIETHGLAFAAWASYVGEGSADLIEQFEDRFQGRWDSLQVYAEHMLDELGAQRIIDEAPEWLKGYLNLDVAGFARDLDLGGDVVSVERDDGGVWVFSGH